MSKSTPLKTTERNSCPTIIKALSFDGWGVLVNLSQTKQIASTAEADKVIVFILLFLWWVLDIPYSLSESEQESILIDCLEIQYGVQHWNMKQKPPKAIHWQERKSLVGHAFQNIAGKNLRYMFVFHLIQCLWPCIDNVLFFPFFLFYLLLEI